MMILWLLILLLLISDDTLVEGLLQRLCSRWKVMIGHFCDYGSGEISTKKMKREPQSGFPDGENSVWRGERVT